MDETTLAKLRDVVKSALNTGKSPEEIKDSMLRSGYSQADIIQIIGGLVDEQPPAPTPGYVPAPSPANTAAPSKSSKPKMDKKIMIGIGVVAAVVVVAAVLMMGGGPTSPGGGTVPSGGGGAQPSGGGTTPSGGGGTPSGATFSTEQLQRMFWYKDKQVSEDFCTGESDTFKTHCYHDLALQKLDASKCDYFVEVDDSIQYGACVEDIAAVKSDASICGKIMENFEDGGTEYQVCIDTVAKAMGSTDVCNALLEVTNMAKYKYNACISEAARCIGASACEKIQDDEDEKEDCIESAGNAIGSVLC